MKQAGQRFKALEGLAVSLLFAALFATPFGLSQVQSGFSFDMLLMTAGLAIKAREDGGREFQQKMLHGDGLQMDYALKTTARAGVCSLEILQGAFPDLFREKGVTDGLHVLRRGL